MNTKKRNTLIEVSSVNSETGELIDMYREVSYNINTEPNFIKLYTDDISRLLGLTKFEMNVMYYLAKNTNYANRVQLTPRLKKEIIEGLETSNASINNAITKIKKAGLIFAVEGYRGEYLLNPENFGKGKWTDIAKIRMNIEYDAKTNTKTLITEFIPNKDIIK